MRPPAIRIPGMGYAHGPPTDHELGVADTDMPTCRCGCPIDTHTHAPDMPCLDCSCETYTEETP